MSRLGRYRPRQLGDLAPWRQVASLTPDQVSGANHRHDAGPTGTTAPWWWQLGVKVLVGLFVALVVAASWGAAIGSSGSPARLVAAALDLLGVVALAARRRFPFTALAVEVALVATTTVLVSNIAQRLSVFLVALALYLLATVRPPGHAVVAAVVAALVLATATWVHATRASQLAMLVPDLALLTAAVAVGYAVGAQRALLQTFRERAEQAEREQQWAATRAVAAERVRLARELHDVVAHHVSLLVVQAGAVRETLPADHVTRPVLESMIDGGRRAMSELREMLGALRLDDRGDDSWAVPRRQDRPLSGREALSWATSSSSPLPRSPQPTIEMLPDLVGGANAAGMPVTMQVEGTAVDLPAATSLSAYRVVQEALTNIVRHAPGAFTAVRLHYGTDVLEVTVRNGPSPTSELPVENRRSPPPASGHGLVGMRERAAQAGGTLTAGPAADGWEVQARFPTSGRSTYPDSAMTARP